MNDNRIGNAPIEPEFYEMMNKLAHGLDHMFNQGEEKRIGFILMTFNFGDKPGRCNYISNAQREDVVVLLREQLAYFEGMPDIPPTGKH